MSKGHSESNDARLARIKREAADWVIKQSYDFTPEDQDQFFEWLAADPEHAEIYQQRLGTWKQLDILADWRPEHSLKPNKDLLEGTQKKRSWFGRKAQVSLALAATLVLGCIAWFTIFHATDGPVPLTSGEFARGYERHVLDDGSIVELNLGSQAFVEFNKDLRRVSLASGEAHFTIAKDPDRPFVVEANGVVVQAVGTIFNVQIEEDSVNVLVTEGRVRVGASRFDEPVDEQPVEKFESSQELTAGQQTRIDLREEKIMPKVETLSEEEVENKLTWLKQVINFDDAPLSDIVVEFNRRNYRKIVIEDPSIADVRLSVTIRPNNIDDFVELLELTADIRAERIDNAIIILRSR